MVPSPFHSLIYNIVLHSTYKKSRIVRIINHEYQRLLATKTTVPPVLTFLNKKPFFCPFSHKLLFYQKQFPLYDRQLPKLCHEVQKQLGRSISIIDVGANIGDTVRNIGIKDAFYLCIEGDISYSKYIKHNLKRYNYTIENVFLNDKKSFSAYDFESANGTGHLTLKETCDQGNGINLVSLDELLETKYPNKKFDLLKIDTDGFDFKIIRGAERFLRQCHPLLFFEWDKEYCKEQGEDPLSIFPQLESWGYSECILFDNFGNPFTLVPTNDLKKLGNYIEKTIGEGLPYYYDVLAISKSKDYSTKQLYNLFFGN